MPPVPSVAMNALSLSLVTSRPLTSPAVAPTSNDTAIATPIGHSLRRYRPSVRNVDSVASEATLRSNWWHDRQTTRPSERIICGTLRLMSNIRPWTSRNSPPSQNE